MFNVFLVSVNFYTTFTSYIFIYEQNDHVAEDGCKAACANTKKCLQTFWAGQWAQLFQEGVGTTVWSSSGDNMKQPCDTGAFWNCLACKMFSTPLDYRLGSNVPLQHHLLSWKLYQKRIEDNTFQTIFNKACLSSSVSCESK